MLGAIMSLIEFIKNIREVNDWEGCSNVGVFEVETGYASFRTSWFPQCSCTKQTQSALQYKCKSCGRNKDNNIFLQAGDGDGIYAVVTFVNQDAQVIAAAILFDHGSSLANKFPELIESKKIRDFDPLPDIFETNLPGTIIGSLDLPKERTVYFTDNSSGVDSSLSTLWVNNWVSGSITAYVFIEDSTDSPSAQMAMSMGTSEDQFTGGLDTSFRPRVVLLISDGYKKLHKNLIDFELGNSQWTDQISAWSRQLVSSNVQPNSTIVQYWNGRLENVFANFSRANGLGDEMSYAFKEYSWYLQGASNGDLDCQKYVNEMIKESNGELEESDLLRDAYLLRGLVSKAEEL